MRGIFLLQAPIDKPSILLVCGFNGTSFAGVAHIFHVDNHGGPIVLQLLMTNAAHQRRLAIATLAVLAMF